MKTQEQIQREFIGEWVNAWVDAHKKHPITEEELRQKKAADLLESWRFWRKYARDQERREPRVTIHIY